MLLGPYPLSNIDMYVIANSIGSYILSRGSNAAHYVGRSDTDLNSRLKSHLGKGYVSFWFETASSSLEAYSSECVLYHKYNPPDNDVHPAVPPMASWKCPVPGCQRSI